MAHSTVDMMYKMHILMHRNVDNSGQ